MLGSLYVDCCGCFLFSHIYFTFPRFKSFKIFSESHNKSNKMEQTQLDQQFAERERELIKLNSKVNAKTKKIQAAAATKIQVHTSNNNLNFYENKSDDEEVVKLLRCKKIQLENAPSKKPHEVNYPHFSRKIIRTNLDIHLPNSSLLPDGNAEPANDEKSIIESETKTEVEEVKSLRNESLKTRFSNESSAISPVPPIDSLPRVAEELIAEVIPKTLDKKNVSNEGLLKLVYFFY